MQAMVVEAQANKEEIKNQNDVIEDKNDAMERLNLEVTVVVTERITLKKELDRMDHLYHQLKKEHKEQRVNYNLLVDEVSKVNKKNQEYRSLIITNENQMDELGKDILELQKLVKLKEQAV